MILLRTVWLKQLPIKDRFSSIREFCKEWLNVIHICLKHCLFFLKFPMMLSSSNKCSPRCSFRKGTDRGSKQLLKALEKSKEEKCQSESENQWVFFTGDSNSNPYYAKILPAKAEDDSCRLVQRLHTSPHNSELYTPEGRIETARKDKLKSVQVKILLERC